jgi:hypothetical protein
LALLEENLCFAGAPYELPLPGDRWVRVVEQRRPDGFGCFAHVDITLLERRQQRLLRWIVAKLRLSVENVSAPREEVAV